MNFQPVVYPFFLVAVQHLKQTPDTLGKFAFTTGSHSRYYDGEGEGGGCGENVA